MKTRVSLVDEMEEEREAVRYGRLASQYKYDARRCVVVSVKVWSLCVITRQVRVSPPVSRGAVVVAG